MHNDTLVFSEDVCQESFRSSEQDTILEPYTVKAVREHVLNQDEKTSSLCERVEEELLNVSFACFGTVVRPEKGQVLYIDYWADHKQYIDHPSPDQRKALIQSRELQIKFPGGTGNGIPSETFITEMRQETFTEESQQNDTDPLWPVTHYCPFYERYLPSRKKNEDGHYQFAFVFEHEGELRTENVLDPKKKCLLESAEDEKGRPRTMELLGPPRFISVIDLAYDIFPSHGFFLAGLCEIFAKDFPEFFEALHVLEERQLYSFG